MKNYIKVSIFIVFAVGLLFAIINLYPSKSFAQRLPSRSTLDLDEDLPSILDEDCPPGICDEEEDNPYLDLGDEENDQLRDDSLPNDDLPDSDLPDNGALNDELPKINELPRTRELPRIIEQPETIEFEEVELPPAANEDGVDDDMGDAIQQLIEDIDESENTQKEGMPEEDEVSKKNQGNLVALSEVELMKKTEEAVLKEEEKAIEQEQEEDEKEIEELTVIIGESEAFQELIPITPAISGEGASAFASAIKDTNRNGIPNDVEKAAGLNPLIADRELVKIKTDLAVQKVKLMKAGKSKQEIQAIIKKELKKKKTERKKQVIRQAAEKKFNSKIASSAQDTNKDGVSDEMEVILGLDPKIKADSKAEFSPAEKMIYGVKTAEQAGKKCTMNLNYGDKLPSKGFTVLAACPKNKTFAIYAIDKKGNETELAIKTASGNSKLVFTVDKKFKTGKYAFQIRPATLKKSVFVWPEIFAPQTANAQSQEDVAEKSDAVIADIVEDTEIPQPVIQKIENIDVADVRDIKVSATADGRIRVTGVTDLDTTIIGTFESAVFTSALLADVENGAFEITSSQPLTGGNHEVAIYASRPEDQIQSPPVKLRFSIIETAKAAAPEVAGVRLAAEEETGSPIIPIAVGGVIIIAIGAVFAWRKSKL